MLPLTLAAMPALRELDRRKTILWVLIVTGLGAALRLAAFGSVPGGLYQDEAFNGLDALRVLGGEHPVYFTANNGREPLFIYLASLSIAWLGRTPAAIRLPAALLGTLTIPITAGLGIVLFNRRVGLLAGALMAVTFWPLHLSRVAFRAVGLPFFIALALAAGWQGARHGRRCWAAWSVAAGLFYGLAFYTYPSVWVTPLALALFALYLWLTGRDAPVRRVVPLFLLGWTVALTPLVLAVAADPVLLFGRAGQVSVFHPDVHQGELSGTLWRQASQTLGMFAWRGDTIPRHNLPGRPVFDPLMTLFFLGGLIWLVRNRRRPAAALTLLWSVLMLLPTTLAEDAPHFLRAVGVLPVALLLPAVGLEQSWEWMARRIGQRWLPAALVVSVLAVSGGLTVRDYFVKYANDPQTGYAFQDAAVELAERINAHPGPVWADERFPNEWESVRYLVDREVAWIPEQGVASVEPLPAALFVWPYEPVEPQLAALPAGIRIAGWRGPLVKGDLEAEAYPLYWGYRLEPATSDPAGPVAFFDRGIQLYQATVELLEDKLQITLIWMTEKEQEQDWRVFAHLRDSHGTVVAQDDGPPAGGTLPAAWWRPGDQVVDVRFIPLASAYDPRQHRVVAGLYQDSSAERLAVLDADGQVIGDEVVFFPAGVSSNQ